MQLVAVRNVDRFPASLKKQKQLCDMLLLLQGVSGLSEMIKWQEVAIFSEKLFFGYFYPFTYFWRTSYPPPPPRAILASGVQSYQKNQKG